MIQRFQIAAMSLLETQLPEEMVILIPRTDCDSHMKHGGREWLLSYVPQTLLLILLVLT